MPRTVEDVETFLHRLNRNFECKGGTFLVMSGSGAPPIAVHVADPIVLARVDIGQLPADQTKQLAVLRQLLVYNASDLVHAAYALEGEEIVLSAGLPLENLDANELAAALSDIDLALARHVKALRALAGETE